MVIIGYRLRVYIEEPIEYYDKSHIKRIKFITRPATKLEIDAWHTRELEGHSLYQDGVDVLKDKSILFKVIEK